MENFLPSQKISQIHGQPKRRGDLIILPLFHPAAALYNGSMRQTLIDDFQSIPTIIKKIDKERNNTTFRL
jgi:DNA polymerase